MCTCACFILVLRLSIPAFRVRRAVVMKREQGWLALHVMVRIAGLVGRLGLGRIFVA